MQSKAAGIDDYLASLPVDRGAALQEVRRVIVENLDSSYEEGMSYGMIGYYVPHRVYPAGYHCDPKQPLPFAALGSQKNHMSLHLMCIYEAGEEQAPANPNAQWFREEWSKAGKKLDMGKACLRFRKSEDLDLGVIGQLVKRYPAKSYIEQYEAALLRAKEKRLASTKAK